jgi:hypothetical protein
MEREHDGLAKAIEALRGLEVWRCEIGHYEQVGAARGLAEPVLPLLLGWHCCTWPWLCC